MGFSQIYDYVTGKLDWLAAGLPTEGTNAQSPRAKDAARRDVPTCRMDERLSDVRERVSSAGFTACVVVNEEHVVLGLLRAAELGADPDLSIEKAMRPGPSTFRPYISIDYLAKYMVERDLVNSPITTSDGRLVGLLTREDATRVATELGEGGE